MSDPDVSSAAAGPSDSPGSSLDCEVRTSGRDAVWVHARGVLDIAGGAAFEAVLSDALASARLVVLDLRRLSITDDTAGQVIDLVGARARHRNRRLVIVRGSARFGHGFEVDGVELADLGPVPAPAPSSPPAAEPS